MDEHRTRIQIFGAEHRQDALALSEMGVDHLGFCPAEDRILAAQQAFDPWGVDSFSRTNRPDGRKDLEETRAFVDAVRRFDEARSR